MLKIGNKEKIRYMEYRLKLSKYTQRISDLDNLKIASNRENE